jgi:hypothetical protein
MAMRAFREKMLDTLYENIQHKGKKNSALHQRGVKKKIFVASKSL